MLYHRLTEGCETCLFLVRMFLLSSNKIRFARHGHSIYSVHSARAPQISYRSFHWHNSRDAIFHHLQRRLARKVQIVSLCCIILNFMVHHQNSKYQPHIYQKIAQQITTIVYVWSILLQNDSNLILVERIEAAQFLTGSKNART